MCFRLTRQKNPVRSARRAAYRGQDMRGNATVNTAMVPLASMFGYVNNLRSMSRLQSITIPARLRVTNLPLSCCRIAVAD